jgi:multidrug efflux pump subunit AcrA (membrane-fusion protein)
MAKKINKALVLGIIAVFAGGLLVGLAVPIREIRESVGDLLPGSKSDDTEADKAAAGDAEPGEEQIVELSEIAQDNIGLRIGVVEQQDYQSYFEIPARVREMPGSSQLHLSSRFEGIVKKIFVSEGQTVKTGDPVYEIELTGDPLARAQSELLEAVQQQKVTVAEMKRIKPLVAQQVVPKKTLLELEYKNQLVDGTIKSKTQELLIRGLTRNQIASIKESQELVTSITISVPEDLLPPQLKMQDSLVDKDVSFTVEKLLIKPGSLAEKGKNLCDLAYHERLVLKGFAFENDLPRLTQLIDQSIPVTVTVGTEKNFDRLENQQIAFLSNHADEKTNTFPFFVYLDNEKIDSKLTTKTDGSTDAAATVKTSLPDQDKNHYVIWKWKPGQRAHIRIPQQSFQNNIKVPRDAVVIEGASFYVFKYLGQHQHDHPADEPDDHVHLDEFERVEVAVLHHDQDFVVIKPNVGKLKVGDEYAVNNATQLQFALLAAQSGGGGHHHHH